MSGPEGLVRTSTVPWPLLSTVVSGGSGPSPPSTPAPSPRPDKARTTLTDELRIRAILSDIEQLGPSARTSLLSLLVQESSPQALSALSDVINARLKRDFLKELPLELALHVLTFVDDVNTLARASAVSRFWRALLEDESTWKRMCWKSGFSDDKPGARSMKHLEFGQRQQEDGSTPAGRERRGTLDRTGLSEIAARTSFLSLSSSSSVLASPSPQEQYRESAWSRGLGVESPIATRQQTVASILLDGSAVAPDEPQEVLADKDDDDDVKAPASLPCSPKSKQPFSYKSHFKRAYLTESNWLHGPGRLLSTQVSAEDGVVTCLGFDNDFIVIGMATNKIHVFRSKDGKYVRTLEGHEVGVWCLVLVSKTSTPKEGRRKGVTTQAAQSSSNATKQRTNSARPPSSPQRHSLLSTPPSVNRRNSYPSFVTNDGLPASDGIAPSDTTPLAAEQFRIGGMGLGAGGETGESAQQANVCGTALGWGQPHSIVVSAGCDREVRVWDLETGECLKILNGHSSTVRCMRVVNGRPIAVSGSRDASLRVWDIEQGKCLRSLMGHEHSVRCMEVYSNKVVSGSYDTTCRLWDIDSGQCLFVFRGHQHQIYAVAFDGVRVVTGSLDSTVRLWSAETGEQMALLQGHTSLVGQLQLDPIANVLVTGGSDGRVIVFSLDTNEPRFRLSAHDNSVTCLQFDDRFIVTGGNDGRVKLWDFRDGKFIRELTEPCDVVWRVAIRDDKCVILCRRDGKTVMDVRTFRPTERELFG